MSSTNYSFFLFTIFSLSNFSNPFTFKHINDDDIVNVERFIRTKTIRMLEQNMDESVLGQHENSGADVLIEEVTLKEYFGDVYYNDSHNFEFLPGDLKLIKLLVDHVQKSVDKNGKNKGLRNYIPKSSKNSKQPLELATKHVDSAAADDDLVPDIDENQLAKLKSALFNKIMEYMQLYKVNEIVDLENIADSIVSVSTQNKKIHGHVYCIVCQNESGKKKSEPKRVSYNDGCWIPSNFAKHLKLVHKLEPSKGKKRKRETGTVKRECKKEKIEQPLPVTHSPDTAAERIWYEQISNQITTMTRAVHQNVEKQSEMNFFIDEHDENSLSSVQFVKTPGDGNCMLHSSAHQIFHHKMNSLPLKTAYKNMRADAVKYIQENFDSFKNEIKGHVYDIKEERQQSSGGNDLVDFDIDKECLFFLNTLLPKNRCWTGAETNKALAIIHKVNIIILYEEGPVTVVTRNANKLYDKTIILAYRLSHSGAATSRNHYDSVTDIHPDVIYALAQQVSKQMSKQ